MPHTQIIFKSNRPIWQQQLITYSIASLLQIQRQLIQYYYWLGRNWLDTTLPVSFEFNVNYFESNQPIWPQLISYNIASLVEIQRELF